MKTKAFLLSLAFFLCLTGLCVTAFLAKREGKENLLIVLPSQFDSPRINVQKIEEFSRDEFLITYEIPNSERVSLPHGDFPVTVIGTNSSFPQILGLAMLEGSFFSEQAWAGKQRHAVLNEKAAFTIFGSSRVVDNRFSIRNETWLVTGVIDDGDDECSRVYVPSSIQGAPAGELLALMSRGYDEAYIKNSIKNLEVREGSFTFFNLGTQTRLLWERVLVIPLLFFALLFIGLLRPFAGRFKRALAALRAEMDRHYTSEILRKNRKAVFIPAALATVLLFLPAAALFLFMRIVSIVLHWQDVLSITGLNREFFYPHLVRLYNFELASRFLLCLTLFFLACSIIFVLTIHIKKPKTPTNGTTPPAT